MKNADKPFIIGKIGSTYGVRGWLKIQAYTEFADHILDYSPWVLVDENNNTTSVEIEQSRMHGSGLVVKLKGINIPEEARLLTGRKIVIERSQLPELKKGEYYWSDLVGLTVINQDGEVLGRVIYLMSTGANDVIVVKGKKEHAIPYLPGTVITDIDLNKKEMHVNWEVI